MHYDMLSLGPARMDVFVTLPDDEIEQVCSLDKKRCMIELGFGDKIPVKTIEFAVGGNTGNNAVGLSRLGFKTAMAGSMGKHFVDDRAVEILKKEAVNIDNIKLIDDKFGFGIVINYQGERTILSYYPDSEGKFDIDGELSANWMYITTAGKEYERFYEEALEWALAREVNIAFNPGSRQVKDGIEKNRRVYENTRVLFVNKEEAARLLKVNENDVDIKDLLCGLLGVGPKIVVITDGPNGAYCFDGERYLFAPIVETSVVERTGAGDAFGVGFLAGFMKGEIIERCMLMGMCNSGSVLGFVGPQKGLLNSGQMSEWLERNEKMEIREI